MPDTELVAQLAHELRSPLNGMRGWVTVLQGALPQDDPIADRAIDGILLGIEQQLRLIEALEQLIDAPDRQAAQAELRQLLAETLARKRAPARQG